MQSGFALTPAGLVINIKIRSNVPISSTVRSTALELLGVVDGKAIEVDVVNGCVPVNLQAGETQDLISVTPMAQLLPMLQLNATAAAIVPLICRLKIAYVFADFPDSAMVAASQFTLEVPVMWALAEWRVSASSTTIGATMAASLDVHVFETVPPEGEPRPVQIKYEIMFPPEDWVVCGPICDHLTVMAGLDNAATIDVQLISISCGSLALPTISLSVNAGSDQCPLQICNVSRGKQVRVLPRPPQLSTLAMKFDNSTVTA